MNLLTKYKYCDINIKIFSNKEETMRNFYNKDGSPIAYTDDDKTIFFFLLEPVAYFDNDAIYSFNGKQLGWFEKEWVRDLDGECVFFTDKTRGGGPFLPFKQFLPFKAFKQFLPFKGFKEFKKIKPFYRNSWSQLSDKQFFYLEK